MKMFPAMACRGSPKDPEILTQAHSNHYELVHIELIDALSAQMDTGNAPLGGRPSTVRDLKKQCGPVTVMRSIPVVRDESIAIAKSYDGIADLLLLDSHRPGDTQIGGLGITHSWELDRKIVEFVHIPALIAGGLGPDNVVDAIRAVQPAGVDSKTKTDKDDGSHTKDLEKIRRFVARAKSQ